MNLFLGLLILPSCSTCSWNAKRDSESVLRWYGCDRLTVPGSYRKLIGLVYASVIKARSRTKLFRVIHVVAVSKRNVNDHHGALPTHCNVLFDSELGSSRLRRMTRRQKSSIFAIEISLKTVRYLEYLRTLLSADRLPSMTLMCGRFYRKVVPLPNSFLQ